MAAGLPVVCFDTGNNRSLLADSGYYAEPGSDESLAAAVLQALADPETARRKGDAGRERVRQRFSLEHCRAFLLDHYAQLSGKGWQQIRDGHPESKSVAWFTVFKEQGRGSGENE